MEHNGTQVIHINFVSAYVDEVYFPQVEIIGDIANAIWRIKERLPEKSPTWDFSYYEALKRYIDAHIVEYSDSDAFPLIPQRVVADIRSVLPPDAILALDNGMYKIWFARNYRANLPNTLLLDNALATMGAGLPSAIASKLHFPQRKVVGVCGDGGFMMNSQELETAVRLGVDLVLLILNDNAFGMIKWKQTASNLQPWGLDYGNPDFVKYAESYGAHGYRISAASELQPLLNKCLDSNGVHLIEVPISYTLSSQILIHDLKEKTATL